MDGYKLTKQLSRKETCSSPPKSTDYRRGIRMNNLMNDSDHKEPEYKDPDSTNRIQYILWSKEAGMKPSPVTMTLLSIGKH